MRLFAAVRPPRSVLDHLARTLEMVAAGTPTGTGVGPLRWTAPETWHLTIAFYGEVPDGVFHDLRESLAQAAAAAAPFTLALRGSGVFSGRSVWVGATGEVAAVTALAAAANEAGAEVTGWADERERSRPHLTVGRVSATARRRVSGRHRPGGGRPAGETAVTDLVRALSVYEGPSWCATELLLVRSEPGAGRSGGPLYTDLAALPLGDLDGGPGPGSAAVAG